MQTQIPARIVRTGFESQNVDIWGNAMAGAMGFASHAQDEAMFAYFEANEKAIFFEGQVRETPFPTQWTDTSTHCGRTCPLHPSDPAAAVRTYQVRAARLFRGASPAPFD